MKNGRRVWCEDLAFRVALRSAAMAASLLRRARAHVAPAAVRACACASRLLADCAELAVASSGARFSSSSAVSGSGREASSSLDRFGPRTVSQASAQLLRTESIAFLVPHSVRGIASQPARLLRQQVQEEVRCSVLSFASPCF